VRKHPYLFLSAVFLLAMLALVVHHAALGTKQTRRVLYWVDPMHPSYRSDKPGTAPDCGMALEPVYAEEAGRSLLPPEGSRPGAVQIDSATQQM